MAAKHGRLDMMAFKHECDELGASRCAIAVTDWNDGLGECQKLTWKNLTDGHVTTGTNFERIRRGEDINTYLRSKGGVSGMVTIGGGHRSFLMCQTRVVMDRSRFYLQPL